MPAKKSVLTIADEAKRMRETAGKIGADMIRRCLSGRSRNCSILEVSKANLRTWLAVLVLAAMGADGASAQSADESACARKNADPIYCRDGKPRPVCLDNGHLVWSDTHDPISQGELMFLGMGGKVPKPRCGDKPKD
jgi:hypothetical protein